MSVAALLAAALGCDGPPETPVCATLGTPPARVEAEATTTPPVAAPADYVSLDSVVWMQRSVEYEAVAAMAYATATRMLDVALADAGWTAAVEQTTDYRGKKPAIILDVDETVLDNSPYAAWQLNAQARFEPVSWNAWCAEAAAEPVPGALDFTQYASSKGVDVFFVTNRDAVAEPGTLRNLLTLGFPVDEAGERLMLRGERPTWTSDKGTRRTEIAKDHRIVMLVGDNLGDFVDGVKTTAEARRALFEAHADKWGTAWIMLPNPDYGSWEHPVYATEDRLDADQQRQKKLGALRAWAGPPKP